MHGNRYGYDQGECCPSQRRQFQGQGSATQGGEWQSGQGYRGQGGFSSSEYRDDRGYDRGQDRGYQRTDARGDGGGDYQGSFRPDEDRERAWGGHRGRGDYGDGGGQHGWQGGRSEWSGGGGNLGYESQRAQGYGSGYGSGFSSGFSSGGPGWNGPQGDDGARGAYPNHGSERTARQDDDYGRDGGYRSYGGGYGQPGRMERPRRSEQFGGYYSSQGGSPMYSEAEGGYAEYHPGSREWSYDNRTFGSSGRSGSNASFGGFSGWSGSGEGPSTSFASGYGSGSSSRRATAPKNYTRSDSRIHEEINDRLMAFGDIDCSDIEVKVQNGEVTLTGTVVAKRDKLRAEQIAESVLGVQDVVNQLRTKRSSEQGGGASTGSSSSDSTSRSGSGLGAGSSTSDSSTSSSTENQWKSDSDRDGSGGTSAAAGRRTSGSR